MLTSFDEKAMDFRHAVRDWLATAIPDEWRSFGGHMQSPRRSGCGVTGTAACTTAGTRA